MQVPQLGLQQTLPELQVLSPQGVLKGYSMMLHCVCEQVPPGGVQMPQLKLQQV